MGVIAALVLAFTAVPAMAAGGAPAPRLTHVANKPLARLALTERQQDQQIRRTKRRLTSTINKLTALSGDVSSIKALIPTVASALTQLTSGLTTVGSGLTTLAASTQTLGTFVTSDEYGIVQVNVGNSGNGDPVKGCFYESSDIPDNVQDAIVSGTCIIPGSVPAGQTIHFLVGIRSNESDPSGGVAGLVSYDQRQIQIEGAGDLEEQLADTGATTANSGFGGAPVNGVSKSPMTSTTETSFPFALISTDKVTDLAENNYSGLAARPTTGANNGGATPRFVNFTIRFNDLTPNPNNPGA